MAATAGDLQDAPLLPTEAVAVGRAVESRRREFATGRACARAALARWGLSRRAIPVGPGGEPLWPAGIVGSITHCEGYRACAVARDADSLTLGIDAEPNRPLSEQVLAAIACGDEPRLVRRLAEMEPAFRWDRLLFSAKEAVFKAWFPLSRLRLGFGDARLAIDPGERTFSARLSPSGIRLPGGVPRSLDGRWTLDGDILLTAVSKTRR